MTESTFDTLTRETGSRRGRRSALKALGAAALAAAAGAPMAAEARKNNGKKKRKKKRGGQVCPECPAKDCTQEAEAAAAARCQSQVKPCEDFARASCAGDATCLLTFLTCCKEFTDCDTQGFITCLISASD